MYIIDAHQDLAWNMLTFGRDYTRSAYETRQREQGKLAPQVNDDTLLGWQDYQRGRVAIIFATLFAAPARARLGEWDTLCYRNTEEAYAIYSRQLDVYHRLADEHPQKFRLIYTQRDLQATLTAWQSENTAEQPRPVGLVLLMENAEGVRSPAELEEWQARGVRIIGPAWTGTRYCGGTREPGALTREGFALLERMAELGFGLDLSHMDEAAALQALDVYPATLLASHANLMRLLPGYSGNRHLSDRVARGIIARGGVIGVVPANYFLRPDWKRGDPRANVPLEYLVAQIDGICQLAGNALHAGIGSDFDGGFGLQSVPDGLDTIADLHALTGLLAAKGYTSNDIAQIFGLNWQRMLTQILPS